MTARNAKVHYPRRKIIRSEEERGVVLQISRMFTESEKAFSLIKRNLNNGYVSTPDKDVPIEEFLKVQHEEWKARERSQIPHSIVFLRNSMSTRALTLTTSSRSSDGGDLDAIERQRDIEGQYRGKYGKFY